jgi:hypothetical protein
MVGCWWVGLDASLVFVGLKKRGCVKVCLRVSELFFQIGQTMFAFL